MSLLSIIKQLGGDSTDLDLIDIHSDTEELQARDKNTNDASTEIDIPQNELLTFINGLQFHKYQACSESSTQSDASDNDDNYNEVSNETSHDAINVTSNNGEKNKAKKTLIAHDKNVDVKKIATPNDKKIETKILTEEDTVSRYERVKLAYETQAQDSTEFKEILKNGTFMDKISSLTLLFTRTKNLKYLHQLANFTKSKSKRESLMSSDAIKDIFVQSITSKLIYFQDSDFSVNAYYKDTLKILYSDFIKTLELMLFDGSIKLKALMILYTLLAEIPESEENVLRLLINKLGDTDKKVQSKAVYLLLQLLDKHPAMKSIVVDAVASFVRAGNERAKYYAINFLNQVIVDSRLAPQLIKVYFFLFDLCIKTLSSRSNSITGTSNASNNGSKKVRGKVKKSRHAPTNRKHNHNHNHKGRNPNEQKVVEIDSVSSKTMAALLTGLNRCWPYTPPNTINLDELYKVHHLGSFNLSIQSLFLIHQSSTTQSPRFYRVLYDMILDPRLHLTSKPAAFLNLLYKCLKGDEDLGRVMAFIKRLVQVCACAPISLVCGILFLVGEVCSSRPLKRFFEAFGNGFDDDGDEVFRDLDDPLTLDPLNQNPDPLKFKVQGLDLGLAKGQKVVDALYPDLGLNGGKSSKIIANSINDNDNDVEVGKEEDRDSSTKYDPKKRDPQYARAEFTCLWELSPFTNHFHPTIRHYATTILNQTRIEAPKSVNYDPLLNHTFARFLDRFVYKAPKVVTSVYKGSSIHQPRLKGDALFGGRKLNVVLREDGRNVEFDDKPVNCGGTGSLDEVFYQKYFEGKKPKNARLIVDDAIEDGSDNSESDDDMAEDEVWKAMSKSSGFDSTMDPKDVDEDLEFDEDELLQLDQSDDDEEVDEEDKDEGDMSGRLDFIEGNDVTIDDFSDDLASLNEEEFDDIDDAEDWSDEGSDDAIPAQPPLSADKANATIKRKSKKDRLVDLASSLGYKGSFFTTGGDFAGADEFEDLIVDGNEDVGGGENDVDDQIGHKRKMKSDRKGKKKRIFK